MLKGKMVLKRAVASVMVLALMATYSFGAGAAAFAASDFESAKSEYEAAVQAEKDARADYDAAKTDYDAAKTKKENADKAVTEAQTALDDAKKAASDKVTKLQSDAAAAVQEKQTAFDSADTALKDATAAVDKAAGELEVAATAYNKEALDQAVSDAEDAVTKAEADLQTAKDNEAAAQNDYDNAGRKFLNEKAGEDVSVEILTDLYKQNATIKPYVGTEKYEKALSSALTIDNLNKAADFVTECNELRAEYHSLPALKINYRLMCLSVTSAAVSNQTPGHVVINEIYGNSNPLKSLTDSGVLTKYPSENLAWGYSDPFDGWYFAEKEAYEEYVASGKYPGMEDMTAYELQNKYYDVYHETGHYLNIIDPDMVVTGYACNAGSTDEQTFARETTLGESVTPEQFKTALSEYAQEAKTALDDAKSDVTDAESTLSDANTDLEQAKTDRSTAEAEYNSKLLACRTAEADRDAAQTEYNTAEGELNAAKDEEIKAKTINLEEPDSFADYQELVALVDDVNTAKADLAQKVSDAGDADTDLQDKETVFETAKTNYETAEQARKTAEETYEAKKPDLTKAVIGGLSAKVYTGKAITQNVTVTLDGEKVDASNYTVSYKNNVNAGTAVVTVAGKGDYKGSVSGQFAIGKAVQKMTVKAKVKTVKAKKLKKKKQVVSKVFTVGNAKGTVTYKPVKWANKKAKKALKLNAKNGKITVKKGTKKGKYKVTVAVTAKGDGNYKPLTKRVTVTVRVK